MKTLEEQYDLVNELVFIRNKLVSVMARVRERGDPEEAEKLRPLIEKATYILKEHGLKVDGGENPFEDV